MSTHEHAGHSHSHDHDHEGNCKMEKFNVRDLIVRDDSLLSD